MLILSIDTSTVAASVAVMDENKLHGMYYTNYKLKHSEKLLPLVDGLLKEINMSLSDMDAFAVTTGPGSFTGLRIGAATIKGYAYALNSPIIPISTLEALSYSQPNFDGIIVPILDAQRNQVYTAEFVNEGDVPVRISEDRAVALEELCRELMAKLDGNKKAMFLGDGVYKFREEIVSVMGEKATFADMVTMLPNAAYAAKAALASGKRESAYSLELNYIRKAQAEENLKK
ncbi:MAG: tRNA (adenosine(37)-N6)-threonylcarbamoyltransferase complex dimerization subunit type 1 TsaB [Eubacteriaceae bacterium]|nr:tRNA (adenosine(37)-N6)-threonylcarbamoyltransferase complex dimerization subunit type 1 TsaB [Eubacteriaceae bacterium]